MKQTDQLANPVDAMILPDVTYGTGVNAFGNVTVRRSTSKGNQHVASRQLKRKLKMIHKRRNGMHSPDRF